MAEPRPEITPEELNRRSVGRLPGLVGLEVLEVGKTGVRGRIPVRSDLLAPKESAVLAISPSPRPSRPEPEARAGPPCSAIR